MAGLTPEDIADLGRWHAIQFRDRAAVEEALDRYERFRRRAEREAAEPPPSPGAHDESGGSPTERAA